MNHLTFRTRSVQMALAAAFLMTCAGTAGATQIGGGTGTVITTSSTPTHVGPTIAQTAAPAKNANARDAQPAKAAKAASAPKR